MVPVGGDVLEGEAKGFALGRSQGRNIEVYRLGVGSAGLENAQRDVVGLDDLAERIFEADVAPGRE